MFTIRDTKKCLRINSFFKRTVLVFFVLFSFSFSMWGATYTWTGSGDGTTWTDAANWDVGTNYPGYNSNTGSDIAVFSTNAEITVSLDSNDITITALNISNSAKVTINGTGSLTTTSGNITRDWPSNNASTLTMNVDFTVTGTYTIERLSTVTIGAGATANIATLSYANVGDGQTSGVIVNGDLTVTTITSADDNSTITVSDTGSVTAETVTGVDTIENNGTLTADVISNSGTPTGSGTTTITYTGVALVYTWTGNAGTTSWNVANNWKNQSGTAEVPDIDGGDITLIRLGADITAETLTFNDSGNNPITIELNGYTLTIDNLYLSASYGTGNQSDIHVYGNGKVITKLFDSSENTHKWTMYNGATLTISENLYANMDTGSLTFIDADGTCTLYVPASGVNVNYGVSKAVYTNITPKPYGEPTIYTMSTTGSSLTDGTGLNTVFKSVPDGEQTISFAYEATVTGTGINYTLDASSGSDVTISNGTDDGVVTIDTSIGENQVGTLKITSDAEPTTGNGIVVTVKTPDGALELGEIRYIKGEIRWTGTTSAVWGTDTNWSTGVVPAATDTVIIPGGLSTYPSINTAVEVGTINIKNNAKVTVASGGTLTVAKIAATGTGKIDASAGTVAFKNSTDSWSAVYPEYSKFGNITIASGALTLNSNMYIAGNFANEGTLDTNGYTVFFEPTSTSTISGSGSTSFDNLSVISQGGKTLTINSAISATNLSLSGTASSNLTINGSGSITIPSDLSGGRYLTIDTVPIETHTYTVFSSTAVTTHDGWVISNDNWWLGKNTIWTNTNNWSFGTVPVSTDNVVIPGSVSVFPNITTAISVGTLTVKNEATLDLAGHNLTATTITNEGTLTLNGSETVTSTTFTNKGTLRLKGSETITGTKTNGTSGTSKVEYYGGDVTSLDWGTSYENLSFASDVTSATLSGLTIANDLTNAGAVTTSGALTVSGDITNSGILTAGGDVTITGDFANSGTLALVGNTLSSATFSGTGSITTTSGTITASGIGGTIPTLEVTTDATINGGTTGITVDAATYNPTPTITVIGKVNLPGGTIGALTVGDDISTPSTLTIGGDLTASSVTIKLDATLVAGVSGATHTITVGGNWTNSNTTGGFTAQNSIIEFKANSTITGSNTFYDLKCTTVDTILSFTAGTTQTVSGTFTTTGTLANPIILQSSASGSTWTILPSAIDVTYTKIKDSINTATDVADKTCGEGCSSLGNNTGWFFPDPVWIGGTETSSGSGIYSWNEMANWDSNTVPTSTDKVTYLSTCTTYPTLFTSVEVKKITIPSGKTLNLAGYNLTVNGTDAGSYTNNGTINTSGGTVILPSATGAVVENGTWNYSGGTVSTISNFTYKNLVISGAVNVSGDITATNGISITNTDTITLAAATTFKNAVTLSADATFATSTSNFALGFDESVSCIAANANSLSTTGSGVVTFTKTVAVKDLTLVGNTTFAGTVTGTSVSVTGTTAMNGGSVKTTGTQLYTGAVTLGENTTLLAGANTVTFGSTINSSSGNTYSLEIGDGSNSTNASFGGVVGSSDNLTTLTVVGTSTISANVTTTGIQTYTGDVTLGAAATLLANSTPSADNGAAQLVTFNGAITGASKALTIGSSTTRKTNVTFGDSNGTDTVSGVATLNINGDMDANTTISAASISVNGTSNIDGGTITTTGTQIYNGNVTLGANTTLIANSTPSATGGTTSTVTFNGNISGGVEGSEKTLTIGNGTYGALNGTSLTCTVTAKTDVQFGNGTTTGVISDLKNLVVFGTTNVKKNYTAKAVGYQLYCGDVTNLGTIEAGGTQALENGEDIHFGGNYTAVSGSDKGTLKGSTYYCIRFEQIDSSEIHVKMGDYTHNGGTICFFGAGEGDTYFEPGNSEYNFIYCRKTGTGSELIFAATAIGTDDQPLVQNLSTGGLYVENGTVQFGAAKLVLRALSVTNTANFIQTGSNGDDSGNDSLATLQRVGSIVAGGTDSIKWDSASQGGSLYLYGNANIVTENYCSFGNKKVYTKANLTLSGAFYDLIIPSGVTVTNYESEYTSGQIRVRHDLTINDGGTYVHNGRPLIIGNNGTGSTETTSDSVTNGTITDSSSSGLQNLGFVTVRAAGQTKVLASSIQTGTLTVANGTLAAGSALTDAHTMNVSGNLSFTSGYGSFTANKSTMNLNGTEAQAFITNAQSFYNVTLAATGTTVVTTTGDLSVTGALTVNTGRTLDLVTNNSALTVTEKTTNAGTINGSTAAVSPSDITFNGEYDGSAGIFSASKGNTIFSSTPVTFNLTASSFTANGGTVKFTGSSAQIFNAAAQTLNTVSFENTYSSTGTTLTDSFTATGNVSIATGAFLSADANTITLNGGNWSNGGTFNYGTGKISITANCTLSGSSTFYNFECKTAGKTLTFTAGTTQTIASGGSLDIEGTSGNLITLKSSTDGMAWTLTSSGTNTFNYVDVKDSTNTSSGYFTAKNSTDSGNNIKWNFLGQVYTWVGGNAGNETSWITKQNWSPASVPGTNSIITIPSGKSYYPILTVALDIVDTTNAPTGSQASITIESGATFDCAGQNIKASKLTNNGTLRFTGVTGQTATLTTKDNGTGLVEYYGNAIVSATWGTEYYKLGFPSDTKGTISTELNVTETTTIVTGTGNDIELSSTDNTFTGNLSITSGGAVKLSSDGSLKIAGGASCDSLEVIGDAILNGTITTTGTASQTYKDDVSLGADTTLIAGTNTVKFDGTVNGSNSLTIGDDTHATSVTFNANVGVAPVIPTTPIGALKVFGNLSTGTSVTALTSNSTIAVTGTTSLSATGETTITSSGDQTYTGKVTLSSATTNATSFVAYDGSVGKTVTFKNTVGGSAARNLTIGTTGKATNAVFEVTTGETGALLNAVTVYGGTTFGKTSGSAVTITTSDAQTYTGAVALAVNTTLTSTLTSGNALVLGKVDASSDGGQSLTVTTGSSTGKINFNEAVGSTFALGDITTNGIVTCADVFTQNTTKTFTVDSGSISVGVNRFVVGALQIANGTTFTQTGSNDAQTDSATTADFQYVNSLENNGSCSWDSGNSGGFLTLGGDISGTKASDVAFNHKNVTLGASLTLSGIFYDLTIPNLVTVTNGNGIRVQRNLAIESGGAYTHNSKTLTLGGSGTETGTIADNNATANNLGAVTITQETTTKTFNTAIEVGTLTMSDTTTNAGSVTFNGFLTAASLTNSVSTNFAITLNDGATITDAVTFNTTGTVTLGDGGATGASADTITFNGGVTHTTGTTKLACALVTSDDAVVFGSVVSPAKGIELTAATSITTKNSSGGAVTLNGTITNATTSRALTIDAGNAAVLFGSTVGGTTPLGNLSVTSSTSITANNTIQSTEINFTGGAVNLKGTVTATNSFESTGTTFDNTGATITTTNSAITINHTEDVTVAAALSSGAGKITIAGSGTTSPVAISGTLNSATGDIDIDSAYTLGITNTITSTTGNVTIDSNDVATLSNAADITTTIGNVTFGANKSGALTTAGNITTSGVEETPSGAITFTRSTTLTGNIVITTNNSSVGGKVLFSSTLDSDSTNRNLTINTGTGSVTFTDKVGATKQIGTTLITCGACTMNNTVKASSISLTNSGLFLTKEDADITLTSGSFSQTSGGANSAVQLAGGIITTGANTISFANDVYLYGADGTDNVMILGGASGTIAIGNPSGTKNLHIAASSELKVIKINSPLTANNIILYGGNLTLAEVNSSITSTSDIILLGSSYNVDDNVTTESPSNISGLFSYNNLLRSDDAKPSSYTNKISYEEGFKTVCPDNTTAIPTDSVPPTFCGKVSVASGKNITVGKNFYANGIELAGTETSTWNLNIPDNNNSISSFAEAYNSSVSYCNVQNTTSGGTHAYVSAAENCTNNNNNSGWSFERPFLKLNNIYTVYDDTIFVEFVDESGNDILIENTNNEINTVIRNLKCNDGSIEFTGAFTDTACTISTNGKGDLHSFYIKTDSSATSRWNTDATGMSSGETQSTDRGRLGVEATHKNIKPNLQIPKALSTLYASLRDSTKNRIRHYYNGAADVTGDTGKIFGNVQDKCSPVLVAVYTGQELHDTEATPTNQKEYDSHNFMEFVFSEEVDINSIVTSDVNIKATDNIGAIENLTNGFEIKGLAKTANGKVNSGSISSAKTNYLSQDNYTHSLYRDFTTDVTTGTVNQTHRIRLSIAGYVDGTVTINSVNYHYWPGFIDEAICPTGNITRIANNQIKDSVGNILDINTERELPQLVIKNDFVQNTLYSKWDTSHPTFAKYLGYDEWTEGSTRTTSEILGADTTNDTKIDQLQMHFFDDTYQFDGTEEYKWTSKLGWNDMSTDAVKVNAQDIVGGSRPFTNDSTITQNNSTSGGIRISSLVNSLSGFSYQSKSQDTDDSVKSFDSMIDINQEITLTTFFGSTLNPTPAPSYDSLYLTLYLLDSDKGLFPSKNFFEIEYVNYSNGNTSGGIITDLAGNLMKSCLVTTIDRTPPKFSLTLAPVGTNQLYVVFSKQLLTTPEALAIIPSQLELTDHSGNVIDSSIISIDTTKSAKKVKDTQTGTGLIIYLTQNVTLQNILNLRLRVKKPDTTSPDPLTGLQDYIPQIYDNKIEKNCMEWYHAHTFSDLGINVIEPLYAFDNKDAILDKDTLVSGEWVVRDFTGTTNNSGRLYTDKDIDVVAQSPFISGESNLTYPLTMFADVNPVNSSLPNIYNENTNSDIKIWLPQVLSALSTTANTKSKSIAEVIDPENETLHKFTVPNSSENPNSFGWKDNSKVEFLFSLGGNTKLIDNNADGVLDMPLYLFRLEDSSDITSLDVWHFALSDLQRQRGGVTILNNVINVNNAEETIIEVNMKQEGSLNVQILTLDGDVVKNLQRGRTTQGYHYYRWDGTNKSGKAVARGMYFVRVVGPGIDETRKVMAVKD